MSEFDLALTLPADTGYAEMVRALVLHGARLAGCPEAKAAAFCREVEEAAREALAAGADVPIALHRTTGPIEVVIGAGATARRLTLEL